MRNKGIEISLTENPLRYINADEQGRDRYDKAERYSQKDTERVQRIPKKVEVSWGDVEQDDCELQVKDEPGTVKVEAPSAEKIRQMLANTKKVNLPGL